MIILEHYLPTEEDHVWGHGKVTASQAVLEALTWDSTLGVADLEDSRRVVYPNPANDRIWLSEGIIGVSKWDIYDIHGRLCGSGNSLNLSSIEVSGLQNGLYLLHVRTGSELQEFRFMKG